MAFRNKDSYMVKILTLLLWDKFLLCYKNVNWLWYLNCTISSKSYMVLMRIQYIQITITKKIKVIGHIFGLDPVKEEMYYTTLWILIINPHLFQNHRYTVHQYWEKVSKIFHTFCLYLRLPAFESNFPYREIRKFHDSM